MFAKLIGLIASSFGPYILGAVGAVVLALLLTVGVQHLEIGGLRKSVTAANDAAHQWHSNYDTVFGSLEDLQDATDQLTAASNARKAKAQEGVDKAATGVSKAQATSGRISAYKPPPGASDAAVALDILKGKAD